MADYVERQVLIVEADAKQVNTLTSALENQYSAFAKVTGVTKEVGASVGKAADEGRSKVTGLNSSLRNLGYGLSDIFSNTGPIGSKITGFGNNVGNIVSGVLQTMGKIGPGAIVAAAGLEIGFNAIGAALNALGVKSLADLGRLVTGGVAEIEHGLDGLKTRIKELESTPLKLAVDVVELDTARKDLAALEKSLAAFRSFEESRSKRQKESGAAVQAAVEESKGPETGAALKERAAREIEKTDSDLADARKRVAEHEAAARAAETDVTAEPGAGDVHRKLADQAREDAKLRVAAIRAKDGAAEKRVGDAREAAGRGDVGDLVEQLKGIGRDWLAGKIEAASPEAMKLQEEGKLAVRGVVDSWAGAADTAIKLHLKKLKDAAKATAAMKANLERGKGIPEGKIEVEPLTPPSRPKPVTVPQKRAKALQEARFRKRAEKAARLDATARRRAALGQQTPGRETPPRGFRSGVPTGAKRPPTLDRPAVAPKPPTVAEAAAQAQRDAQRDALIARADADAAARQRVTAAAVDRAKAQDAERRAAHPRGPMPIMGGGGLNGAVPDLAGAGAGRDQAAFGAFNNLLSAVNNLAAQQQASQQQWAVAAGMASQARAATTRLRGGR